MQWNHVRSNQVFFSFVFILFVMAGCSGHDDALVVPVDTPEGTAYVAFEVHRNSLAVTDAGLTDPRGNADPALIAVGGAGRGLLYPNDYFATPLLLESEADFTGLHYFDDDQIFACGMQEGGSGVLQLYDGEGWRNLSHAATGNFTGMSRFFLCTDEGEILMFVPVEETLELIHQAPAGVRLNGIYSVLGGHLDSDMIAVGDGGAILHRYGSGVFVDESIPDGPDFIAVSGSYDSGVLVVGYVVSEHEIWQFEEGVWSLEYKDPGVTLNNIKYLYSGDAVAVGDGGLILNGDEAGWTVESLGEDVDLVAVAKDMVFDAPVIHLFGSQGEVLQGPNGWVGLDHHAAGPWSTFFTTTDGTKYAANGASIMRFADDDWSEVATWDWGLNIIDLHVVDATHIWVIGEMSEGFDYFVLFYNGSDWQIRYNSSLDKFSAIWCDADGTNVFVAADRGQILWHHDGIWEPEVDLGNTHAFHELYGSHMEDLVAVGDAGLIMRRGPKGWSEEISGTTHALRSIHDSVAVGDGGTILSMVSGAWESVDLTSAVDYNAVWFGSDKDIWAVGDDASVMHYDGTEWTRLLTHLPGVDFIAATGAGIGRAWIGGTEGYLLRSPQ